EQQYFCDQGTGAFSQNFQHRNTFTSLQLFSDREAVMFHKTNRCGNEGRFGEKARADTLAASNAGFAKETYVAAALQRRSMFAYFTMSHYRWSRYRVQLDGASDAFEYLG